jgi:hypothetical protein
LPPLQAPAARFPAWSTSTAVEADGVEVTLIENKKTVHGFDIIGHNEIVQHSFNLRTEVLKKAPD